MFNSKRIISIHPEFRNKFEPKELESLLSKNEEDIIESLQNKFGEQNPKFRINKTYRYSIENENFIEPSNIDKAETMLEYHKNLYLIRVKFLDQKIKNWIWESMSDLINQRRAFICCSDNDLFAESSITTIINGGGNIGVSTQKEHRQKGYGKAVVSKVVKHCFANKIIPIYLVDRWNESSIALAESIGFKLKSSEIMIKSNALGREIRP